MRESLPVPDFQCYHAFSEVNLRSVGGASDSYTQLSMGSKGYSHSIGSKGHSHSVGSKGHSQNNSNLCSNNHSGSQLSGNHSVNSHGHDFRVRLPPFHAVGLVLR